jgi:hypothetical protein
MRICALFWSVALVVGAVVLGPRPTFWARRYALGIATAGLLNVIAYFGWFRDFGGWCFGGLQTAAFIAIFAALLGKRMRAFFDERDAHWQFDHPTMHLLATALSLNVAGIAMLVYYATLDSSWTTNQLRAGALCVAAALSVGSILAARGRIVGLFVMTAAGLGSLWLGWSAYEHIRAPAYMIHDCGLWEQWQSWGQWETVKSLVGFVPAALGSLLCFGVFLGPMVRFVRNRAG